MHISLQIVDGTMSACEQDYKYYGEMELLRGSDGIIVRKVRSLLNREKSTDNIIDARQSIHPCISNAPMFYYLHCFIKFYCYVCYMLVANPMVKLGTYHSTKSIQVPIYTTQVST